MGRPGAFLSHGRKEHDVRPTQEAISDFDEIARPLSAGDQRVQASRCMYCGVAFCQSGMKFGKASHVSGCPLHNLIPETNDLVWQGRWDDAASRLALTNPLPEFTGRVCPAPCEVACNLGLHNEPVTIRDDERAISDHAWEAGMQPLSPAPDNAPRIAVIGSGPAGLACAWELARLGKRVTILERHDRAGGLLMYGIPNMKLPKDIVQRRLDLMAASGIEIRCGVDAADSAVIDELHRDFDAIVIAAGATDARRVKAPGMDLDGVVMAVDYLTAATRSVLDGNDPSVSAKDKDVMVIGGGDTGTDCVATALRQGAHSVHQVIRAQQPPATIDSFAIWPEWPNRLSVDYGQAEAADLQGEDPRIWSTDSIAVEGSDGAATGLVIQDLSYEGGRHNVEGTERTLPAQLILIAKGFLGPEQPLLEALGVELPASGKKLPLTIEETHRALTENEDTPVFVAGDARTGSTLVVNAIADGLACAREIAAAS
ncbi:MAG: glutamate synthase subunit beta [Eggerthellaceae bacterium]|jgi:glutamate synthase (NADPH/NADH) small chain